MLVKILSWNIWGGKHLDDVIAFLKNSDADIIGLQEIIERDTPNGRENIARIIADKLGYEFAYCRAFTTDRHESVYDIGNAILGRFKIEKSICHELSGLSDYQRNSETEPRVAIEADFKIGDKELKVLNTHLAYSDQLSPSSLRNKQVLSLVNFLDNKNTVLMGDFNSLADNPEVRKINNKLVNADSDPSEPTWSVYPTDYHGFAVKGLEYRIDHIFASSDIKVSKFDVLETKASDHLPISCVIEL